MLKQIFAYGTLMRAGVHAELLARRRDARFLGPARCRGQLYDLGNYPSLVVEGRTWVAGELFRCDPVEDVLRILDAFEEDGGFERSLVSVRWRQGETQAWTYVYAGPLGDAVLIPGGSYRARLKRARRIEHGM